MRTGSKCGQEQLKPSAAIASRIVEARRAAGFATTTAFAAAIDRQLKKWGFAGISRAAVAQWENGDTRNLRPENLFAVAEVTGHSAKWIAIGLGVKYHVSEDQAAVVRRLAALPQDTRDLVVRFIDSQT